MRDSGKDAKTSYLYVTQYPQGWTATDSGDASRVLAVIWPNTGSCGDAPRACLKRGASPSLLLGISASAHAIHRAIPTTSKAREPRRRVAVGRRHRREAAELGVHRRHSHLGAGRSRRTR